MLLCIGEWNNLCAPTSLVEMVLTADTDCIVSPRHLKYTMIDLLTDDDRYSIRHT